MKLGSYCRLALGMAGLLAIGTMVIPAPAEAWPHRPGRTYRCCWKECRQWQSVPGTIGARCLQYRQICRPTTDYRACYGKGPG